MMNRAIFNMRGFSNGLNVDAIENPLEVLQQIALFTDRADKLRCWPWTGKLNAKGYPVVFARGLGYVLGHRLFYSLATGTSIPNEMVIAHHCDNPRCMNLSHLFLTTSAGNTADMNNKGRHGHTGPKGERARHSKLTAQTAFDLANKWAQGESIYRLAKGSGLSSETVRQVITRDTWDHIWTEPRMPFATHGTKGQQHYMAKVPDATIPVMHQMRQQGYTYEQIGNIVGLAKTYVYCILAGKSRSVGGGSAEQIRPR